MPSTLRPLIARLHASFPVSPREIWLRLITPRFIAPIAACSSLALAASCGKLVEVRPDSAQTSPDRDAGNNGAPSRPGDADASMPDDTNFDTDVTAADCEADNTCPGSDAGEPEPDPVCGDGERNQSSEVCDDGNIESGDGCTAACQVEANFACPNPGDLCVSTVECGDDIVSGEEQCDDGNLDDDDGCDGDCQLEAGWACPFPGVRCEAAECGDSLVVGFEQCDDGDSEEPGCDDDCRLEEGYKCDEPGEPCEPTTCLDGDHEGSEQCDDGNNDLGDGCTPLCKLEPDCSAGACTSACGDGIKFAGEECDDGNTRNGDGCSSECEEEEGFTCDEPNTLPSELVIPVVFRDFVAVDDANITPGEHPDFELESGDGEDESDGVEDGEDGSQRLVRDVDGPATGRGGDMGAAGETWDVRDASGAVIATVSLAGKPVYFDTTCDRTELPGPTNDWGADIKCSRTTYDVDSFHQWYTDGSWATTVVKELHMLQGDFDEASADFVGGGDAYVFDSRYMLIDGSTPDVIGDVDGDPVRTRGFFPIDEFGNTGQTCDDNGLESHNFHFTSEVRQWFEFDASAEPTLRFSGDDDVWVYVNGHLALDIGGIHGRIAKQFTIDDELAEAWGLEDGSIYEIAVFQAERNQCASNYWLTLEGFFAPPSTCESECGDGIVASNELCDDGPDANDGEYGNCGPDCRTRGPYCGDGETDEDNGEECDDGVNLSLYDFDGEGCAPGCLKPPYCGNGEVESPYEECDDGEEDNNGEYGGCNDDCTLAPFCGDGELDEDAGERCDDGNRENFDRCDNRCQPDVLQ